MTLCQTSCQIRSQLTSKGYSLCHCLPEGNPLSNSYSWLGHIFANLKCISKDDIDKGLAINKHLMLRLEDPYFYQLRNWVLSTGLSKHLNPQASLEALLVINDVMVVSCALSDRRTSLYVLPHSRVPVTYYKHSLGNQPRRDVQRCNKCSTTVCKNRNHFIPNERISRLYKNQLSQPVENIVSVSYP